MGELDTDFLAEEASDLRAAIPGDEKLASISAMVLRAEELEAELKQLEEDKKVRDEERRRLVERDIPDAMREVGLSLVRLTDGSEVSLKDDVYASIPEAKLRYALGWLRQQGFGDIIKNEVRVAFGSGEDVEAQQVADFLLQSGRDFARRETVHPQTLRAFAREQLQRGKTLPEDGFAVHTVTQAKVKRPK
jgi:hypothetical protein